MNPEKPVDSTGMHNVKKVFKQTTNGVSRLTGKVGTAFSEMGSQMKNKMMNNNQGGSIPRYPEIDNMAQSNFQSPSSAQPQNSNLHGVLHLSETTDSKHKNGQRRNR